MIPDKFNRMDAVNFEQPLPAPAKEATPASITKHEELATASVGAKALGMGNETTKHTPVHREQIPPPTERPDTSFVKVSLANARRTDAADKLFRLNMSPGREKLLREIAKSPGQLETDLKRLGAVHIGNKSIDHDYYAHHEPDTIYKFLSAVIKGHVAEENQDVKVSANKMDEILNSVTQSFPNSLWASKTDVIPSYPWAPRGDQSRQEVSFQMEETWFKDPHVLIASTKTTKVFENTDDPSAKPKTVIMETLVKHNLKNENDVQIVYRLTIDGKKEEWDPTKN